MARRIKKVAVVFCNGGSPFAEGVSPDALPSDCAAILEQYPEGVRACTAGCLGGGTCAEACKFDAIAIGPGGTAVVDEALCRGCGLCAKKCPQQLIALRDRALSISVRCSNADAGAVARKACDNSCIACGICVKKCPAGALSIEGGHAVIDDAKCIACGMCAVSCPRGAIRDADGIFTVA